MFHDLWTLHPVYPSYVYEDLPVSFFDSFARIILLWRSMISVILIQILNATYIYIFCENRHIYLNTDTTQSGLNTWRPLPTSVLPRGYSAQGKQTTIICNMYFEERTTTLPKYYRQLKQKNESYFRIIINNHKTDASSKGTRIFK